MFQIFLDMSKKVGIFMIISQTLLHIGIAKTYEKYIWDWHEFVNRCEESLVQLEEKQRKILTLYLLKTFYQTTYPETDFYQEFYKRLETAKEMFGF